MHAEAASRPDSDTTGEPPFEIVVSGEPDRIVLHLHGELDLCAGPPLDRIVAGLVAIGVRRTAVDLSAVTFADAAGLRALMASRAKLVASGGDLVVRAPNRSVRRLLVLLGPTLHDGASSPRRSALPRPAAARPAHRARAAH